MGRAYQSVTIKRGGLHKKNGKPGHIMVPKSSGTIYIARVRDKNGAYVEIQRWNGFNRKTHHSAMYFNAPTGKGINKRLKKAKQHKPGLS